MAVRRTRDSVSWTVDECYEVIWSVVRQRDVGAVALHCGERSGVGSAVGGWM